MRFWYILIQNPSLLFSDKILQERISFMSLQNKLHIETWFIRSVSVNNCGIQNLHRSTYLILIRWLCIVLGILVAFHYLARTIIAYFQQPWPWIDCHDNMAIDKIAARRSLWSSSFNSKLPALNLLNQLRMIVIIIHHSHKQYKSYLQYHLHYHLF